MADYQEPWRQHTWHDTSIENAAGVTVAFAETTDLRDRIIACVNACEGSPNKLPRRRGEIRHFTVWGRGPFPVDMLRFDCCWPMGGDDAANLEVGDRHRVLPASGSVPRPLRRVVLCTTANLSPTLDRWRSFNWVVREGIHQEL